MKPRENQKETIIIGTLSLTLTEYCSMKQNFLHGELGHGKQKED